METKALEKRRNAGFPVWDNFFNSPLDEFFGLGRVNNLPSVNVSETDTEYKLCMAAPGLDKTDFKIEMIDDMLTIRAEKETKEEKNGRYNRREYNYSSWSRSFAFPDNANGEKIDANYKNGELTITIPKTAGKENKPGKTIPIN